MKKKTTTVTVLLMAVITASMWGVSLSGQRSADPPMSKTAADEALHAIKVSQACVQSLPRSEVDKRKPDLTPDSLEDS